MHKTITAKNSSLKGSSLFFHNLEVASVESGVLRLQVPNDRAAHCRINQFLKTHRLPVVLDVRGETAYLKSRETGRDVVVANFPRWNEPGACAKISRSLGALVEKKAA
jgi:hypothetical protein